MTFIPSVLSKIDDNNSYTGSLSSGQTLVFNGTDTTGYNGVTITIETNETSSPLGLIFSGSNDNITWSDISSETIYANVSFLKNYEFSMRYYRFSYTTVNSCTISIQSRLSTSSSSSSNDSYTVFNNDVEASLDAFGKLRVSNPYTLLDIRFPGQSSGSNNFLLNSNQLSQYSAGTGGSTYNITASDSKCILTVTGDRTLINQSRKYCNYQPGKSLLFLASAVLNNNGNPGSGFSTRLGYYDNNNGLYYQYTAGSGISVNIKNSLLTTILQSSWNIDRMDGTGTSKLNLDFSKTQLFVIDMEWLGVGIVRFGFYAYGKIHYCHQELNINILTSPYTNGINLPIRHEIIGSVGLTSASMTQICSTVISEGGYNPIGRPFSISTENNYVTLDSTEIPVILLRGGSSNYRHQSIFPTQITTISNQANDLLLYRARFYSDSIPFTVSSWTDVGANSVCQYALGSNVTGFSATGSTIIDSGYFYGKSSSTYSLDNIFSTIFQITSNASDFSDVVVLTVQSIVGSGSRVYGTINWQEIY